MSTAKLTRPLWVNTRIRSTPFSEQVEAAGVSVYSVYNHMLLPVAFEGVEADYWHLKRHVQVWDVSSQRQVELRGPDATRLMQLMTPRDVTTAAPYRCLYTPLVDRAGGMVNDPVVLKLADDRYWISIGDSDVVLWADGLATGLGLDVEVFEPDVSPLAVQGPDAEELVARVFGEAVRGIGFFRFEELLFDDHQLVVARTGWSKQGGFEIYVDDASLGPAIWSALFDAGADLGVRAGCPNLIERIEGGLLSYGGDFDRSYSPFECGFGRFVHLDRPIDFVSRTALERLAAAGPRRQVVGLVLEADPVPPCRTSWPVTIDGERIGSVTSAANSPVHGCGVAIATVDAAHAVAGTEVVVDAPGAPCNGRVSDLPFGSP